MQNNQMESIWADGVPAKINDEDLLTPKETLRMCINFTVANVLTPKGYELVGVNDDLASLPNIVVKKDEKVFSIIVVPCIFPNYMRENDDLRIKFVNSATKAKAIPVICPVLIHSYDKERAQKGIMLKGDLFRITNIGQKILNNFAKQSLKPEDLDFNF